MGTIGDIITDIAPELAGTDAAKMDRFIGYATDEINVNAFGSKANMAIAYLTAHKLTIAGRKGANQGPVVGERVGDLERRYAPIVIRGDKTSEVDPALVTTSYGVEFSRLCKLRPARRGIRVL